MQSNNTLYNPTWIQAGILKIKDTWNQNLNTWKEPHDIIAKFPFFFQRNNRGIMEEYRRIRNSVEKSIFGKALLEPQPNAEAVTDNLLEIWYFNYKSDI